MKTTLKIQLIDSSEDGWVCFGDIMTIPYNTTEELFDEKKWLQHIQQLNIDAQEFLDNMQDLIVHLKGYETFCYFNHMFMDESIQIENALYEKFNTYK